MPTDEFEDRRAFLASLSSPGGPLTIDAPHATINDRRYFRRIKGEPIPTRARLRLHERILVDWRSSCTQVRRDRVSILMAGPPGAGKSTAQAHLVGKNLQSWRHLDADEFKLRLVAAAVEDGSLQQMLPEELRAAPGQPSRFYPNELCALVHMESNLLLETAVAQSLSVGENVIIDGTMAWKPWATELVTRLERERYTIHVADVEASRELATARIVHRWQQGLTAALTASGDDPRPGWVGGGSRSRPSTVCSPIRGCPTANRCTANRLVRSMPVRSARNRRPSPATTCTGRLRWTGVRSTSNAGNAPRVDSWNERGPQRTPRQRTAHRSPRSTIGDRPQGARGHRSLSSITQTPGRDVSEEACVELTVSCGMMITWPDQHLSPPPWSVSVTKDAARRSWSIG